MHARARVSAAYTLLADFVEQLTTKAFEAGLGQPRNLGMDSLEALHELAQRYELESLMSFELQPIANRSVAILQGFGGASLCEPMAQIEGMVSSLLPPPPAGRRPPHPEAMHLIAGRVTLEDRFVCF